MEILEILKYVLPSGIVFLTAYYLLKGYWDSQLKQKAIEIRKDIIPFRLQAYERMALFLERINPESLLMRISQKGMNAQQLQYELIKNIRSEYEHNLSQQIYMSSQAWEAAKNAKEENLKIINLSMAGLRDEATAMELSRAILESLAARKQALPSYAALEIIKREIRQYF